MKNNEKRSYYKTYSGYWLGYYGKGNPYVTTYKDIDNANKLTEEEVEHSDFDLSQIEEVEA